MRTQVGIIGAGPAGLLLSHLLHLAGIESIVLESKSRHYVEHRVRAGLLEQSSVDLINASGLGARMQRESLVHDGINLCFDGKLRRIDMYALTGRRVSIYGQQECVKDMIAVRLAAGGAILFEAEAHALEGVDTDAPVIHFKHDGSRQDARLRFHRRLRRFPRHCARCDSARRSAHLRPHLSVRLARHARRSAALGRRIDLLPSSQRLCSVHDALADLVASLSSGRSPTKT